MFLFHIKSDFPVKGIEFTSDDEHGVTHRSVESLYCTPEPNKTLLIILE